LVYGDPIHGKWPLWTTEDGGKTWTQRSLHFNVLPKEAGFAASGTGAVVQKYSAWIASGGDSVARVYNGNLISLQWTVTNTPIQSGEGAGIFSMAFANRLNGIVVGGKYTEPDNDSAVCAYTTNGSAWQLSEKGPRGYRSGVSIDPTGKVSVCVGRNGSDYSVDGGRNWNPLGDQRFNAVALGSRWGWAVGPNGRVARLDLGSFFD
jgi:hypothetical protein